MDFKIDDVVKIISNECGSLNKIGDVGVVTKLIGAGARVEVDGRKTNANIHPFDELELVKRKKHELF